MLLPDSINRKKFGSFLGTVKAEWSKVFPFAHRRGALSAMYPSVS